MEYPDYFVRQRVSQNGLICWRTLRVSIGYLLAGEWIGMEEVGHGFWTVNFGPVRLGSVNQRDTKEHQNDYLTIKM